jgi:hypothetical protein
LSLDGWLLWSGLVGAIGCLLVGRLRPIGATVLLLVAAGLRPGYLPQPYVIVVLPFAALAVSAAAGAGWDALRRRPPVPIRDRGRRHNQVLAMARALVVLALVGLTATIVPTWLRGDAALAGPDESAPVAAAEHWLETHALGDVQARSRSGNQGGFGRDVLVDDTMWTDLVTNGFPQRDVIWFYKLDYVDNLDPSVRRQIHDYRDFGFVVSTPIIRSGLRNNPPPRYELARLALAHARLVASFGTGPNRIDIERVHPTTTSRRP